MNQRKQSWMSAFTLVELLAAMAVLGLLMATVFGIFNQASRAWTLAENRTENFQNARMALDMISRELEGAIVASNAASGVATKMTLATFEDSGTATIAGSTGTFTTSYGSLARTSPNDAIFFVSQMGDSRNNAYLDLVEYGYYVGFVTGSSTLQGMKPGYYYLMRHYIRSSATGFDVFGNPTMWWNTPTSGTQDQPIIDNAVRFEVWYEFADPYNSGVTNGTRIVDAWDLTSKGPNPTAPTTIPDPSVRLPRAFHLRLSVLDRRYAARLAAISNNGSLGSDLSNVPYSINSISSTPKKNTLKEGLRTFFRSVYPRGAS